LVARRRIELVARYLGDHMTLASAMLPPSTDLTKACRRAIEIDVAWGWNRRSIVGI